MNERSTLFALLRDRRQWRASLTGLVIDPAGDLRLRPLPGSPEPGYDLPPPYDVDPSGLAVAPCGELFASDGTAGLVRILFPTGREATLSGASAPAGLALRGETLAVADSDAGRILGHRLPDLHSRFAQSEFVLPADLAIDAAGRVVCVERGYGLRRLGRNGGLDESFDAQAAASIAVHGGWNDPAFITVGAGNRLFISDLGYKRVLLFDDDGRHLGGLPLHSDIGQPGALLAVDDLLYAADRASGRIWAYELSTDTWLGTLSGWRGPVAALASASDGALWVKPGTEAHAIRLDIGQGLSQEGVVEAGPFDAGLESGWSRIELEAQVPAGGEVDVDIEVGLGSSPDPIGAQWGTVPGLRAALDLHGPLAVEDRRFGWLRIRLRRGKDASSLVLQQAMLLSGGPSMVEELPRAYSRQDGALGDAPSSSPRALLRRLLELLVSDLAAGERVLDGLAQRLTTEFASPGVLQAMADWMAFDLPTAADDDTRRRLLARAVRLHARRGTPASIREMARLYGDAHVTLAEGFRERAIWILGESSALGFDTMLPPVDPAGLVVPGDWPAEAGTCPLDVGQAVVGEMMPLAETDVFEPLFSEWAHRFVAIASPGADRGRLSRVVETERPAHVQVDLCVDRPGLKVGSTEVGRAVLADGPSPGPLGVARLGSDATLAPTDEGDERNSGSHVGTALLGMDSRLG